MRLGRDAIAGLLFVLIGAVGLILYSSYDAGTALQMGPSYMPNIVCWMMVGMGILIAAKGWHSEPVGSIRMRPLVFVCIAVVAFGLVITRFGILAAVMAAVIVGSFATPESRRYEVIALAVVLALGASGLFVYGLGVQAKVLPF